MEYFLASSKLNNEKSGGKVKGKYFATDRKIDLLYIGLNSLETELERLCAFSSLAPEKAVARLGEIILPTDRFLLCMI